MAGPPLTTAVHGQVGDGQEVPTTDIGLNAEEEKFSNGGAICVWS